MQFATVFFEGENGIYRMDVIDYEGEPWLVPMWMQNRAEGWMKPARIVRLASFPHDDYSPDFGYVVNFPLPRDVFEGQPPPKGPYTVILEPDIRIPTGGVQ